MSQQIRVLVADDRPSARKGMKALLTFFPEIDLVGVASDGREAINMAEICQPDVILMDMQMPVMDGIEATRLIKNKWPMIKIIALTMYGSWRAEAMRAGVDAILLKGFEAEILRKVILETQARYYKAPVVAEHVGIKKE
jgi:DNA-binding NarL/FixJ family response regulator